MSRVFIAAIAALCIPAAAYAQSSQQCAPVTEEQVAGLFDRWNASLQTRNPDEVVKNYAPGAVLLPTVSNKPRTNPAEIRDYFVHFLAKNPKGAINTRTIHLGCNDAFDVGTYTFTVTDADGKAEPGGRALQLRLRTARREVADRSSSLLGDARERGRLGPLISFFTGSRRILPG